MSYHNNKVSHVMWYKEVNLLQKAHFKTNTEKNVLKIRNFHLKYFPS
jgi:hypothetical protein